MNYNLLQVYSFYFAYLSISKAFKFLFNYLFIYFWFYENEILKNEIGIFLC